MISHLNNFLSGASAESVRSIIDTILALTSIPEVAEAGSSLLEFVSIQESGFGSQNISAVWGRVTPKSFAAVRERGEFINIHVMPIPL